ncbi:MAG: hypothetical protein ACNI3H_05605 [Halarcobacter ebronensis]|uniref:hypothetical protein n=1 Tax=Halarcobacter ebronensis TaxID=1462615 RepID=UPI003C75CF69
MYISKELLEKEYDNPKIKLKDMIENVLSDRYKDYLDRDLDITKMLETIGVLNAFCKRNNFKLITVSHIDENKGSHCYRMLQNYQSEFLVESDDLYSQYFASYKYEFKPEKLDEIKKIVIELKTDIKEENTLSEEEQEDIITIINEVDESLKPETNDIDTINGKLFRLKMTLHKLGITTGKVNDKINTVFSKVNDVNTFISNVQSIYSKVDGLITNVGKLLGS